MTSCHNSAAVRLSVVCAGGEAVILDMSKEELPALMAGGKNKTVNPTWCNRQVGFTALQQKNGKRTKFEITGCAL